MECSLTAVQNYLSHLSKTYGLQICIKDFVGFTEQAEISTTLAPFLIHSIPFCMLAKSDKSCNKQCLKMVHLLMLRMEKSHNSFIGSCHLGIRELVCPIVADNAVIGSINVGPFPVSEKSFSHLVTYCCRHTDINKAAAIEAYHNTRFADPTLVPFLQPLFELLASHLALIYLMQKVPDPLEISCPEESQSVFECASKYIHSHYTQNCSVSAIAKHCHCSSSYINHLIKKRTGSGVRQFVNKLRIEQAKSLLITTDMTITDISEQLGFYQPSYFTTVFTSFTGRSPRAFRKDNQKI